MKKLIVILILLLLALGAAVWYLKFYGVTHEEIYEAVTEESAKVQVVVDDRYQKLDQKLGRLGHPSHRKQSMMVKLHEGLGIPYENMMETSATPRYRKVAMF